MNDLIKELLKKKTSLSNGLQESRANCFNAVQLYFEDSQLPQFCGPEDYISYISRHFLQINLSQQNKIDDVVIVWSRSSDKLPHGEIRVEDLKKEKQGYPFGLVIEHSYVVLGEGKVFQKLNPKPSGCYSILCEESALMPYKDLKGFERTLHRRKCNSVSP